MMPISHFAMTAKRGKLPVLKRPSIRTMSPDAREAATIDLPGDGNASIRMQKGAIASICLDSGLSQPGELQWLVTAQVIEAAV